MSMREGKATIATGSSSGLSRARSALGNEGVTIPVARLGSARAGSGA